MALSIWGREKLSIPLHSTVYAYGQGVELHPSLYTPQLGSGVHAPCSHHGALRVESHADYLSRVSTEGVKTLAILAAPQLTNKQHGR